MDTWDIETLLVMSELGNRHVNDIYECQMLDEYPKPNSDTDAITRRTYIEAKYVRKLFLRPLPSSPNRTIRRWNLVKTSIQNKSMPIWNPNFYLYDGARQRNVPMMLHGLALGADKNYSNEDDQKRTPLIQAILSVGNEKKKRLNNIFLFDLEIGCSC